MVSIPIEDVTAIWDRCFREIGRHSKPVRAERTVPIIARLREQNVSTVLDLGSGCGRWSIPLTQDGFAATTIAITPKVFFTSREYRRQPFVY